MSAFRRTNEYIKTHGDSQRVASLDVERGNRRPNQVPFWLARPRQHNVESGRPSCEALSTPAQRQGLGRGRVAFAGHSVRRARFRDGRAHLCSRGRSFGRNFFCGLLDSVWRLPLCGGHLRAMGARGPACAGAGGGNRGRTRQVEALRAGRAILAPHTTHFDADSRGAHTWQPRCV